MGNAKQLSFEVYPQVANSSSIKCFLRLINSLFKIFRRLKVSLRAPHFVSFLLMSQINH